MVFNLCGICDSHFVDEARADCTSRIYMMQIMRLLRLTGMNVPDIDSRTSDIQMHRFHVVKLVKYVRNENVMSEGIEVIECEYISMERSRSFRRNRR
jgi:hypothetical protein